MPSEETGGSFYSEIAAGRSRSPRLSERARELGLATEELRNEAVAGDEPESADVTPLEIDSSVSDEEVQEAVSPDWEIPADPVAAEPDPLVSYKKFELADEARSASSKSSPPVEGSDGTDKEQEATPEEPRAKPEAEEEVASQEAPPSDEPQASDELEARAEAEHLVDQIGPIVDFQSLPKTKPMRVLSKTAPKKPEAKPVNQKADVQPPESVQQAEEDERSEDAKPKKKRASLLDSYFKGL